MMKVFFKIFVAGVLATVAMGNAASATPQYNQSLASPYFYAGSGIPYSGFTVNAENGVEIGLGVHYRYGANVLPSPTNGSVYTVQDGGQPCYGYTCALWNFDFSVNLNVDGANPGLYLSDITSQMTLTNEGTGDVLPFDPLSIYDDAGWDGSKNTVTDNTDSSSAPPAPYDYTTAYGNLSNDWGFQNSENFAFFPGLSFNPYVAGTYKIELSVNQKETGASLGSVSETINAVPSPGTLPLFASGLGIICLLAWRRKRKAATLAA